jgi:hypothetical protein
LAAKEKAVKPNWKIPVGLAGVLAILIAFASWYQFKHVIRQAESQYQIKNPLVIPSPETSLIEVKIKNPKGLVSLQCVSASGCTLRNKGEWKIGSAVASSQVIQDFLLELTRNFPAEPLELSHENLRDFGLSDEQRGAPGGVSVELTVADAQGNKSRLNEWFGSEDGIGESVYAGSGAEGTMNTKKIFVLSKRVKILTENKTAKDFLAIPSAH